MERELRWMSLAEFAVSDDADPSLNSAARVKAAIIRFRHELSQAQVVIFGAGWRQTIVREDLGTHLRALRLAEQERNYARFRKPEPEPEPVEQKESEEAA